MLPELFDLMREINGMPKPGGRAAKWQSSVTQRRVAAILVTAMPMLINVSISLGYFLSGRGKWLLVMADIASLLLLVVVAITILRALKRPISLDEQRDQLDWLDSTSLDDEILLWQKVAARLLHQSFVLTLLGIVPVFSAVTCTAAITRTTRAMQIIHHVGLPDPYRRAATIIRFFAVIILGTYGAIATFLPFFSLRPIISPPIVLQR